MRKFQVIIKKGNNSFSSFERGHYTRDAVGKAIKKAGDSFKDFDTFTTIWLGKKPFSLGK